MRVDQPEPAKPPLPRSHPSEIGQENPVGVAHRHVGHLSLAIYEETDLATCRKHQGIYAYRSEVLLSLSRTAPSSSA